MTELHGWITIRGSFEVDTEDYTDEMISDIEKYIERMHSPYLNKLGFYNGEACITFAYYPNHFSSCEECFELMKFVGEIAVGSYGLIYLYDDENQNGKNNSFQVFALARGKIVEYEDQFLSPVIPKLEDEEVSR